MTGLVTRRIVALVLLAFAFQDLFTLGAAWHLVGLRAPGAQALWLARGVIVGVAAVRLALARPNAVRHAGWALVALLLLHLAAIGHHPQVVSPARLLVLGGARVALGRWGRG